MTFWEDARSLPSLRLAQESTPELQVSFLIPAHNCKGFLEKTVLVVRDYLENQFHNNFEIILIPNGTQSRDDPTVKTAEALAHRFPEVRTISPEVSGGKGIALRTGFTQSRGKWIFFMDADLPYDIAFFSAAARLLADGVDFVTGNRRLPQSHFDVPVPILHLAYRRHCAGVIFNRVVRWLFPLATTDTQAGIKAMSRAMAEVAFSRQVCPGFFFDIEFFLCCSGFRFRSAEIPVTLFLNSEKSSVQLFRESLLALIWLSRIFWRFKRREYSLPREQRSAPAIKAALPVSAVEKTQ